MRARTVAHWFRERADDVTVVLIGTMFVCFLLQIAFRYVLNRPLGWTEEVTVLCWVWVVLWGAAFVLRDSDEVRFDIVYGAVPEKTRRAFVVASGIAWIALLAVSLPATLRYVAFMKREHSAYLHMRFDILYAIYPIFVVALIIRYVLLVRNAIRGTAPSIDVAEPLIDIADREIT